MLVATRDPMHHSGAPDPSSHRDDRIHVPPPRTARVLSLLQLAGSFLAIPVALGSAYSVYNANFSPDTQCQQLRASIIAMIDKKIDAATRRMLVRRDVETFEKSCGAFDPDAKAAFVTLLQAQPRTVPERPVAAPKADVAKAEAVKAEAAKVEAAKAEPVKAEPARTEVRKIEIARPEPVKAEAPKPEVAKAEPVKSEAVKSEAPAREVARKPEARSTAVAKQAAPAAAETEAFDPAVNDARWLDAVRGALVSHDGAREAAAIMKPRAPAEEAPALRSSVAPTAAAVQPEVTAPALPPATAVGEAPAPSQRAAASGDDHPVPPGAIPDQPPLDIAQAGNGEKRSSSWISNIPLVGQILDK
ncbi:hypothetical protein [Pseudolabrys taiwanensis]|uniref:hypothetical protein n=1 Tax=Pseudolabrys taiwanensis TaxID=331696 RepID=UPI0013B380C3|nr:hypothetical protein [Pseudolabrys taiwanensis]